MCQFIQEIRAKNNRNVVEMGVVKSGAGKVGARGAGSPGGILAPPGRPRVVITMSKVDYLCRSPINSRKEFLQTESIGGQWREGESYQTFGKAETEEQIPL